MKFSLRTLLLFPLLMAPLLAIGRLFTEELSVQAIVAVIGVFVLYVVRFTSLRLARSDWDASDPLVFVCRGGVDGAVTGAVCLSLLAAPILLHVSPQSAGALVLGIAALGASLGAFLGSCTGFAFDLYVAAFRADLRRAHRIKRQRRHSSTYV